MKIQKFALAALCLSFTLLPSCSEGQVDAKGLADKATEMAGDAADAIKDIDLSALSPEALM
ncbi:MAG: hypothetical protein AAF368_19540, partial [Planctomycetota bacterium]